MSSVATVRAPSTLRAEARRFWALTWVLAVTQWKLRFYGSVLGYAWSLVRPFLLFGVIYVVFVEFARLGEGVLHFPSTSSSRSVVPVLRRGHLGMPGLAGGP